MSEHRGSEGGGKFRSRFKLGLETPLVIRFSGESKIIASAPRWYDVLVLSCFLLGLFAILSVVLGIGGDIFFDPIWRLWTGVAVIMAGVWAALSNERLTLDTQSQTYTRWEGKGPFKSLSRGAFSELDAVVLLAESTFGASGPVVTYRLVVHWKGSRLPLLVVSQETAPLGSGAPLNFAAGRLLGVGQRASKSLGVPFYDNSYFHSPEPLRPL